MYLIDKYISFCDSSTGKKSTCNAGDLVRVLVWEDSPGQGNGYSLQFSGLENSIQSMGSQTMSQRSRD